MGVGPSPNTSQANARSFDGCMPKPGSDQKSKCLVAVGKRLIRRLRREWKKHNPTTTVFTTPSVLEPITAPSHISSFGSHGDNSGSSASPENPHEGLGIATAYNFTSPPTIHLPAGFAAPQRSYEQLFDPAGNMQADLERTQGSFSSAGSLIETVQTVSASSRVQLPTAGNATHQRMSHYSSQQPGPVPSVLIATGSGSHSSTSLTDISQTSGTSSRSDSEARPMPVMDGMEFTGTQWPEYASDQFVAWS